MLWAILALLSAFIWAIVNIIDKYVVDKWVRKPEVILIVFGVISLIASFFIYLFKGFDSLSYLNIGLAFIGGIIYILGTLSYFEAVKRQEISRIVPLFHLTPLIVLVLATIFLQEIFTIERYLGIFLLVAGSITISSKNLGRIRLGKSFYLMIIAVVCFGIHMVIAKYLLRFADYWTVFSYIRIGTVFVLVPIIYFYFGELRRVVRNYGKKVVGVIAFNESLNIFAAFLFVMAAAYGYVTLVESLTSVQSLFVLMFAVILSIFYPKILREEISKKTVLVKLFAIVMMIIGTILII